MINKIHSPTLVLDKEKCLKNIKSMAYKARSNELKFRPHFKTHQSLEIGKWFKEFPIDGITVSSLKMAEFFAEDDWKSITIAFPVNILEVEKIDALASKIELRVLAVSAETVKNLDTKLTSKLGIYIEIDPGYGRSGILYSDEIAIKEMIESVESATNLELIGFYSHAGHSYKSRSENEILQSSEPVIQALSNLKRKFNYPICFGDTPSCSVLKDFGDIDEISPGNFVFYDWIQTKIGSCNPEQIAVAMYCPVVAKYEMRNELLIHGGAVHFSKDFDTKNGVPYFGQVVENKEIGWGSPIKDCYLKSISQEHGVVSCTEDFFTATSVGDLIPILPIHSCLTADLMGMYVTTNGEKINHLSEKKK